MTGTRPFKLSDYKLPEPWHSAAKAIIRMWTDGPDPRDLVLPKGYWSDYTVERYAREYCEANPRTELGIVFGLVSTGVCVAAQGGMMVNAPKAGGGYLEIPSIEGIIGVSPSGTRKSTLLDVARVPLARALEHGVERRTKEVLRLCREAKAVAENGGLRLGEKFEPEQFNKIYNSGICGTTLVKDPTPEAMRNLAVNNGGVVSGFAGEPEIFSNINGYSKGSGPLNTFLDGWDQASIEAARVGQGDLRIPEAAVLIAVLLQNEVFAEVTGGIGPGGVTGDNFVGRGMFGRYWVVRTTQVGGFEEIAARYADDNDFVNDGPEGYSISGRMTPLGAARAEYEAALHSLVEDTDEYRAMKAMRRAWEKERIERGTELQVPEIERQERYALPLDRDARLRWRQLQRFQLAVEGALYASGNEDAQLVFGPLAARLSQHAMRTALTQTLGCGMRALTGEAIQDAACRIVRWRVAHSTDALMKRSAEIGEETIAKTVTTNSSHTDLSADNWVKEVIVTRLAKDAPPSVRDKGFTRTEIKRKCLGTMPKSARRNVGPLIDKALELMVNDPQSGITLRVEGQDAIGRPTERFQVMPWLINQPT
jgi:uncharacterized protein DUF3987